jgi:uncharacterized protein YjbI with pentapeptide repeats
MPRPRSDVSDESQGPLAERVSLSGVVFGLASAALAVGICRVTGTGWIAAIGLAVLLGAAIYLWAGDENKGWGDLGQGMVIGVVVAISLMAVQRDAETRRERSARDAEIRRERSAERQSLQLALTMQNDLRRIALAGRDLHGFFLAEKRLDNSNLEGTNLMEADLQHASLTWANLAGARLDEANLYGADLSGISSEVHRGTDEASVEPVSLRGADLGEADLVDADLFGADLTRALLVTARLREAFLFEARLRGAALIYADLRDSDLEGADLRGSRLGGATLCRARLRSVKLEGALYDDATRWPPGFDPTRRGARRTATGKSLQGNPADLASGYQTPEGGEHGVYQRAYPNC